MGVSTNFYTIYGVRTEWDSDFSEAYDEVYKDPDVPFVLMDSMGGEYFIFGIVLFNSGDMRWGFENGDAFKEIDLGALSGLETEYRQKFIPKFPQFASLIDQPFKLMTLAHYG